MGIFGGIGKALKGVDWGNVMSGLQSAGAISHGDYGTAAQIQGLHRQRRDEQDQQQAAQQQAEAAVGALVRQGIPEADARAIVASGAADTVLSQRFGQRADSEFDRSLRAAGIDPASPEGQALYRQRVTSMASNPVQGQWTGSPESGYTFRANPTSGPPMQQGGGFAQQQGGTPPPEAVQALKMNPQLSEDFDRKYGPGSAARAMGGGASNGPATFPGFQRVPGGQLRFP